MLNTKSKETLFSYIKEQSYKVGDEFTLSSGKKSNVYFNMKPIMFNVKSSSILSYEIAVPLSRLEIDYIGGLEMGSVPITASVVTTVSSFIRPGSMFSGFFVRKEVKKHGTQQLIEGLPYGETLEGKRVVILEDVTTTGQSAMKAVDIVRNEGAKVMFVQTIIDREEGAEQYFLKNGLELKSLFKKSDFGADQ
jgi:orotate phosphoribosyltransferase